MKKSRNTGLAKRTVVIACLSAFSPMWGQVDVDVSMTPQMVVDSMLVGEGIIVSNVTFTGEPSQIGIISGFTPGSFPIDTGIVLGCGDVQFLEENASTGCFETNSGLGNYNLELTNPIAADLLTVANSVPSQIGQNFEVEDINDMVALEFDFTATGDSVSFRYIFATTEFPNFVNSDFNDVFAFFLSGPGINGPYTNNAINIATVPGFPDLPITVSSVNNVTNPQYFVDNSGQDPICPQGYTDTLTCFFDNLECGGDYHITMAVADGTDDILSSFVILEAGSFQSPAFLELDLDVGVGEDVFSPIPILYEDCGDATLTISRPDSTNIGQVETVDINYAGTAEMGVDFEDLPTQLEFGVGVMELSFPINVIVDNVPEPTETVMMTLENTSACGGNGLVQDLFFQIQDWADPLVVVGDTIEACSGEQVLLDPNITGGFGSFVFDWDCLPGGDVQSIAYLPPGQGTHDCQVIVNDVCDMPNDTAFFTVIVDGPVTADIGGDIQLSCVAGQTVSADVSGGVPGPGLYGYDYFWYDQSGVLVPGQTGGPNLNINTSLGLTSLTLEVFDACGIGDAVTVNVSETVFIDVTLPDTVQGTCLEDFTLTPIVTGGSGIYTYNWSSNFSFVSNQDTYTYDAGVPAGILLEVQDNCQATGNAFTVVNIVNPEVTFSVPDTILASCIDNTLIEVGGLTGAGDFVYDWSVDGIPYDDTPSITVMSDVSVGFEVTIEDGCGGESEEEGVIIIPDVPMSLMVSNDTAICRGDRIALIAHAEGGEEGFTYTWPTISPYPYYGDTVYVDPANSSTYPIEVTDICGEALNESVTVLVEHIHSDFYTSYLSDSKIEFIATPDPPCVNCTYEWDFGDGAESLEVNPIHDYDGINDYYAQLTVTTPLGCADSAYTLVEGQVLIYIPSAFTPNNDGINDAFQIVGTDLVYYELTIYNRWGSPIFHSTDPQEVWTGNVNGGEHYAPEGLYGYRLKWQGSRTEAEEMLGTFELMR